RSSGRRSRWTSRHRWVCAMWAASPTSINSSARASPTSTTTARASRSPSSWGCGSISSSVTSMPVHWTPEPFAAAGAALLLALSATPARGQEPRAAVATERAEDAIEHRNEGALIVAGTAEHEGGTFFTLGGEYERRLNEHWAIGGEVEHLFDANRWVVAAPVTYHAGRGLKFFPGPGFDRAHS